MGEFQKPDLTLPLEKWLSPKELAAHFGLSEDSAYRWLDEGTIARRFVRHCGRWRIRIHPAAIAELQKIFEQAH
jgi:predicted site-specific integrase-resolvase